MDGTLTTMTSGKRDSWVTSEIAEEDKTHQLPNSTQVTLSCLQDIRPATVHQQILVRKSINTTQAVEWLQMQCDCGADPAFASRRPS